MIISTTAKLGQPKFTDEQRQAIKTELLKHEGKTVWVTISAVKPIRTLEQNAYLWGVVYQYIADETGHTTEEIHEQCKSKFIERMWTKEDGREIEMDKSTTNLTTKKFADYITEIIAWASAEFAITIPEAE